MTRVMSAVFAARRVGAALALVITAAVTAVDAQDLGISVGATAPSAPIETLDGKTIELSSITAGKPTLLEFWATWCGNCKQLEPGMVAAHKKYGTRMQFVAVAVSLNQSIDRVKTYRDRFKSPFLYLYDRRGDVSEAFDAPATSYVVILDKNGKVSYTGVGGTQNLEAAIVKALADQ
jgi:thiol-disulfide isomerase/thioredoxin